MRCTSQQGCVCALHPTCSSSPPSVQCASAVAAASSVCVCVNGERCLAAAATRAHDGEAFFCGLLRGVLRRARGLFDWARRRLVLRAVAAEERRLRCDARGSLRVRARGRDRAEE